MTPRLTLAALKTILLENAQVLTLEARNLILEAAALRADQGATPQKLLAHAKADLESLNRGGIWYNAYDDCIYVNATRVSKSSNLHYHDLRGFLFENGGVTKQLKVRGKTTTVIYIPREKLEDLE